MLMVHVNGKDYEVEQDTKLMRFLRDDLRLTSVKDGCSQGACGTCTVLVDGKATKACIPMLSKLQGKSVVTVEGLSEREKADISSLKTVFTGYNSFAGKTAQKAAGISNAANRASATYTNNGTYSKKDSSLTSSKIDKEV